MGQDICRLFQVLAQFAVADELLNHLRLRMLENWEITRKALKCLDLMASTHPTTQKKNFSLKISAVKHFIEKSILPNFVNLCKAFCPILSEERISCFNFVQTP